MGISTYLAAQNLNSDLTGDVTVYLALYSENPTDDNSGSELSGNGYARKAVTFGTTTTKTATNNAIVTFDTATGSDWATATHWGILDAANSGNLMYFGPWDKAKIAVVGQTVDVAVGELKVKHADS